MEVEYNIKQDKVIFTCTREEASLISKGLTAIASSPLEEARQAYSLWCNYMNAKANKYQGIPCKHKPKHK